MDAQIPVIAENPLAVCGCRKFQVDALGDHLCTCTTHSGVKKDHDWVVDQLPDLFHTTHKVKTHQVLKSRGQHCGDIELVGYLANAAGPVPLVLDLCVAHDSVASSADLLLSYVNITSTTILIRPGVSVSCPLLLVRLAAYIVNLSEFYSYRIIGKLTAFFATSGVTSSQSDRGFFHYLRAAFSSMLKSRVGNILCKASALHLVFVFRCSSSTTNPVSERRVDSSFLDLSVFQFHDQPSVCETRKFLSFRL
jgi:hypothetical protein